MGHARWRFTDQLPQVIETTANIGAKPEGMRLFGYIGFVFPDDYGLVGNKNVEKVSTRQTRVSAPQAILCVPDLVRLPSDLGHQLLKTIRPNSSSRRLAASGLLSLRKGSARSKNYCCFRISASMPFSINSTSMRVALSRLDFAMVRTGDANLAGKLTLWRTVFGSATFM